MNGIFRGLEPLCLGAALSTLLVAGCKDNSKAGASSDGAAANVGKTESRDSMSSSSSSSSSGDHTTFSARHVLFVNESDHPLIHRVVPHLTNALKTFPQIERLDVTASHDTKKDAKPRVPLAEGSRSPDLFIGINLRDFEDDGVVSRTLHAEVTCSLGTVPWQSSHHSSTPVDPPTLDLVWNGTLDHNSTFTGIHSDRQGEIAKHIAGQLAKALTNKLEEVIKQYPPLPRLPDYLYGPYEPVADFDFLKKLNAQRAGSYHGLFTHNETFWTFDTAANPVPHLEEIVEQLRTAQWKVEQSGFTNRFSQYISATSGGATLEVFRRTLAGAGIADEKPETALQFVARYRKPFSPPELQAGLEKLLAENIPVETLMFFENSFWGDQRRRFYSRLESAPASSPHAYLTLANAAMQRKDTNRAIVMLTRAKAMSPLLPKPADIDSKIESAAKKISKQQPPKLEVTVETYRALGFVELTNLVEAISIDKNFGQPMVLFTETDKGPHVLAMTVEPPRQNEYPWTSMQFSNGSRGMISSSFGPPPRNCVQKFTLGTLKLTISVLPDQSGKGVRYTVQPEKTELASP